MSTSQPIAPASDVAMQPRPVGHRPVVVGHDRHPAGDAALEAAVELAERLGVDLHVVHCITLEDYGIDPDGADFEDECRRNLAHERDRITDALRGRSVHWHYHEELGEPVDALERVAHACEAGLIVVGAARGPFSRLVRGERAVPSGLTRRHDVPVLVVPSG